MAAVTQWYLRGKGYEFCNCAFGCGCNFAGVPNSKDGSCRALVGCDITDGKSVVGLEKAKITITGAVSLEFDKTNWIFYEFDWSNSGAAAGA